MKKLKSLLHIMIVLLLVFSCKDDEKPDPLATAEGDYTYTVTLNYIDGTDLTYLEGNDKTGEFKLVKNTDGGFEINEGTDLLFQGSHVSQVNGGFTFAIEDHTVDFGNFSAIVKGYDGATFGNGKFHGTYEASSKKLTGYMQFAASLNTPQGQIPATIVMHLEGVKK